MVGFCANLSIPFGQLAWVAAMLGQGKGASGNCPQIQGCRGPERRIYAAGVESCARLPHKCGVPGAVPGGARRRILCDFPFDRT